MKFGSKKFAFTLIELLVVVAIIALLLSILLPSLSGAREQGKRAKCLANLSNIGKAVFQYANEDKAEQIIPISQNMIRKNPSLVYWEWRTINWFTWGGRSSQTIFKAYPATGFWLSEADPPQADCIVRVSQCAKERPLNSYMLADIGTGDSKKMEWYECPGDKGYPDSMSIDDSPQYNAERRCYDSLGNSYRASLSCIIPGGGGYGSATGAFAFGPWGHRVSSLQDTGRTVLIGEPSWFNMIGVDIGGATAPAEVVVQGWHGRKMVDNLAYCDGSARSTKAEARLDLTPAQNTEWGVDPNYSGIHRGSTYRLDVYPVGGAIIFDDSGSTLHQMAGASSLWPWKNFQDNLHCGDGIDITVPHE